MKGLSVIITVLLVALAQLLAQCLQRSGVLPIQNRAGTDHWDASAARSVLQPAQSSTILAGAQITPEDDDPQVGSSTLRKRIGTGPNAKPFRFPCTALGSDGASLLRF